MLAGREEGDSLGVPSLGFGNGDPSLPVSSLRFSRGAGGTSWTSGPWKRPRTSS